MKITEVAMYPVSVPYTIKTTWSRGEGYQTHNLIVRVSTDEGDVGWGETIAPSIEGAMAIIQRDLAPLLVGRHPNINEFWERARLPLEYLPGAQWAISGLDTALWDIRGRRAGLGIAELLGGPRRDSVEAIGYLFIDDASSNVMQAEEFVARGHRTLKMKVGRSIDADEKRLAAVRSAVGDDILIRIDPNAAWDRYSAIDNLRRLSKYSLEYVEQPLHPRDLEGMAALRRLGLVPIAADESCGTFSDATLLVQSGAVDVLVVYVTQAGGISEARRIGELASEYGVRCVMGSASELGIATTAQVVVSACAPGYSGANDTHLPLQRDDVCVPPPELHDGQFTVPLEPGLGIRVEEEKLVSLRDEFEGVSYSLTQEPRRRHDKDKKRSAVK
jgi:L-alanine-DL-glutamate epimerase-like enolase superfamily enzyme